MERRFREGACLMLYGPEEDGSDRIQMELIVADHYFMGTDFLIYYVLSADPYKMEMNTYLLVFDQLEAPHDLAVIFTRGGRWIGYLTTIKEQLGREALEVWEEYKNPRREVLVASQDIERWVRRMGEAVTEERKMEAEN